MNRDVIGPDPDRIYVGDMLDIPCKSAELGVIDWSVMPSPDAVATLKDRINVQIVDIRSVDDIAKGFIPGSLWLPYALWRGAADNPGAPWSAAHYSELIGAAGVRLDQPILVVHSENTPMSTGAGAYVYWVLKSLGAEQMTVLRDGFDGWKENGHPISFKTATATPYDPNTEFSAEWRATETEVWAVATDEADGILLDARPRNVFNRVDSLGKVIANTIPTATNLPAPQLMAALSEDFDVRDGVDAIVDAYRSKDALDVKGSVITFCKSGQLSALNWFYASELASIPNVRLYPESLTGWKQTVGVLGVGKS
jgi:thiosulfate/3-mercaptopyruvate sulfurtransferase